MTIFIADFVFAAPASVARPRKAFARRLLGRLASRDAGYRNADALSNTAECRLADMGFSRMEAEAEFARYAAQFKVPHRGRPLGDPRPAL